ncbi:hypothetical protein NVP3058O_048 [Vibrio phage 3.058.O._10N.286.46.B8]|nr:hypothetical protein NVP3058O_048 [Vibrio phage 3.058.O._10N.286.46.B8]
MSELLRNIEAAANAEIEEAVQLIALKHEALYRAELVRIADEFNKDYTNHVIKFSDGMGQRSIEVFHRLRQNPDQNLMWFTDGECFMHDAPYSDYSMCNERSAYEIVIDRLCDLSKRISYTGVVGSSYWMDTQIDPQQEKQNEKY